MQEKKYHAYTSKALRQKKKITMFVESKQKLFNTVNILRKIYKNET